MTAYSDFAERLEIFFGQTSDASCHVYARLQLAEFEAGLQLAGRLTGPTCLYADTLPARFSFVDRPGDKSLVAEAIVPEPCFWTPEMPQFYQAAVELQRESEVLASSSRMFGIRRLGAHGRKLFLDTERWVLRGTCRDEMSDTDLANWHQGDVAMIASNPDDTLCREASRVGVLLVALDVPNTRELQRLSRWPAVAIASPSGPVEADIRSLVPNLLLAQHLLPGESTAPWAHVALVDVINRKGLAEQIRACPLPVIATRTGVTFSTVAEGRSACDRLQGDLAGRDELAGYDFAGYVV